jgi:hypothetical protein
MMFRCVVILLLFRYWEYYFLTDFFVLNMKDRPLPNGSFYVIVDQLSDDGQKIGRNMS